MTDADRKRAYVSDLYPGANWKKRVGRMGDEQVTAIYLKHQKDGVKPDEDSEQDDSHFVFEDGTHEGDFPMVDIPVSIDAPGPHHNEDDFYLY